MSTTEGKAAPAEPPVRAEGVLGCALNFSEGRDRAVIQALQDAADRHAAVLDLAPDADHNRTVATLGGRSGPLVDAVVALASRAVELIDLNVQQGAHPRMGAVDVVPFYPVGTASRQHAIEAARRCASLLCARLDLPCFLYEDASDPPGRPLPWIRRHAFEEAAPDCGPPTPHPSAGAGVIGARGLLVAYNVLLTGDVQSARKIAAAMRSGATALAGARTLGLWLQRRALAQVSVNITDPGHVTLAAVYEHVARLAAPMGVRVVGSEVIGLVPRNCLGDSTAQTLQLTKEPRILEDVFSRLR